MNLELIGVGDCDVVYLAWDGPDGASDCRATAPCVAERLRRVGRDPVLPRGHERRYDLVMLRVRADRTLIPDRRRVPAKRVPRADQSHDLDQLHYLAHHRAQLALAESRDPDGRFDLERDLAVLAHVLVVHAGRDPAPADDAAAIRAVLGHVLADLAAGHAASGRVFVVRVEHCSDYLREYLPDYRESLRFASVSERGYSLRRVDGVDPDDHALHSACDHHHAEPHAD